MNFEIKSKYLDKSFDDSFQEIPNLKWLPWVGVNYKDTAVKTMVLGESVYDWAPDGEIATALLNHPNNNRRLVVNHAFNFDRPSPFVRNFERAFYNKKKPTAAEKELLWSSSVYHNLAPRVLKSRKQDRPKDNDYFHGWSTVVKLIDVLNIDSIFVYGVEDNKIKALKDFSKGKELSLRVIKDKKKIGRCYPRSALLKTSHNEVDILFIRHPSAFFSWQEWANRISQFKNTK